MLLRMPLQLPRRVTLGGFHLYVAGTHFTRTVSSSSAVGRALRFGGKVRF